LLLLWNPHRSNISVYQAVSERRYSNKNDRVGAVWFFDTLHICLVMASIWSYLIPHFGDVARADVIPWTVAVTIAVTAIMTIIVHCFLAGRIHSLTKKNWRITGPILVLALLRLGFACFSTVEMIRIKTFTGLFQQFPFSFTAGLGLASVLDALIASVLCYKLRRLCVGLVGVDYVIDALVIYTFENGLLTCAGNILAMIFRVAMPYSRTFLGVYFIIAKLYANTLLATLNSRKRLRESQIILTPSSNRVLPITLTDHFSLGNRRSSVS